MSRTAPGQSEAVPTRTRAATCFAIVALGVLILVFVCPRPAVASPSAAEEWQARQARLRAQLAQDLTALQASSEGSAEDKRLREDAIVTALQLSPPPEVSNEAKQQLDQGRADLAAAQSEADYRKVVSELRKSLKSAPWLAEGYAMLASAEGLTADYEGAIQSARYYLLAAPQAIDAEQTRQKILAWQDQIVQTRQQPEEKWSVAQEGAGSPSSDWVGAWWGHLPLVSETLGFGIAPTTKRVDDEGFGFKLNSTGDRLADTRVNWIPQGITLESYTIRLLNPRQVEIETILSDHNAAVRLNARYILTLIGRDRVDCAGTRRLTSWLPNERDLSTKVYHGTLHRATASDMRDMQQRQGANAAKGGSNIPADRSVPYTP